MSFEKPEEVTAENPNPLVRKLRWFLERGFSKIEIRGEENLKALPSDAKVILAPTHLSDSDVPLTIGMLGDKFKDIAVVDASTHHNFFDSPMEYIGNVLGGKKNFIPVSQRKVTKKVIRGKFESEDFEPMHEAIEKGKALIISAYYNPTAGWKLPDKGGHGAVYLAQIADAFVVPVAVNIKSKEQVGMAGLGILRTIKEKPEVEIVVGKPMAFPKIDNVEQFSDIIEKRKSGPLVPEDREKFRTISDELRENSDSLMMNLARMLPKEKRGVWEERLRRDGEIESDKN